MRPLLLALVLLPALAPAGAVKRPLFAELEKKLDSRLEQAIPDAPFLLLGNTRGVYLEKYGAVFTTEVSLLATATVSPFMQTMPPAAIVRVHNRKLQRLPVVKGEPATWAEASLVETFNDNVDRLNGQLFSNRDYAVIGRRP